MSDLIVSLL